LQERGHGRLKMTTAHCQDGKEVDEPMKRSSKYLLFSSTADACLYLIQRMYALESTLAMAIYTGTKRILPSKSFDQDDE